MKRFLLFAILLVAVSGLLADQFRVTIYGVSNINQINTTATSMTFTEDHGSNHYEEGYGMFSAGSSVVAGSNCLIWTVNNGFPHFPYGHVHVTVFAQRSDYPGIYDSCSATFYGCDPAPYILPSLDLTHDPNLDPGNQ